MVRLVDRTSNGYQDVLLFQFQYGAIGGPAIPGSAGGSSEFQFQYGAIGGLPTDIEDGLYPAFQFQYGAIGGRICLFFQSAAKVSIPVWCDWWEKIKENKKEFLTSFNSSMVRLVGSDTSQASILLMSFQFQYGAIGGTTNCIEMLISLMFQFQYGAIGGADVVLLYVAICIVSIPVWCDWWIILFATYKEDKEVSIPVWCDWWAEDYEKPEVFNTFQFQYGAIGGRSTTQKK